MNRVAEKDQLIRLMHMTIEEVRPGYAKVSMPLTDPVKNGMGFAHGGTIFSLADIAFGAAANDGSDNFVVTLSTTINYIRPGATGPLVAIAEAIHQGKHIQNYEVKVYDGDGKLIAQAISTGYTTETDATSEGAWDRLQKDPNPVTNTNNYIPNQPVNKPWPQSNPSQSAWDNLRSQPANNSWGSPQTQGGAWDNQGYQNQGNAWGNLGTPPPSNIPAGFDVAEFLQGARVVYERLQAAWDRRDLNDIALFATPSVMNVLQDQLRNDPNPSQTELLDIKTSLIKMHQDGPNQRAQVLFDVLMRESRSQVRPERVKEIWHFVRQNINDSWKLDGIQQTY